jgi:hypothetical protein
MMQAEEALEQEIRQMQPLIILGMHRSGTSLMVRLLAEVGVHLGSWLSRDAESVHFQGLNRIIYQDTGSDWGEVDALIAAMASEDFIQAKVEFIRRGLFQDKFTDFIKQFNPILQAEALGRALADDKSFVLQYPLIAVYFGRQHWEKVLRHQPFAWGWKDPRTTLTFPIWMRIFPNARVLHVLRNGIDVAISTHRRSEKQQQKVYKRLFPLDFNPITLDFGYCFHLWETYVNFVIDHRQLISPDRYLEIRYEDLLVNPLDYIRQVTEFIDYPVKEEILSAACEQIDQSRINNAKFARPYHQEIAELADSPLMAELGYSYSIERK